MGGFLVSWFGFVFPSVFLGLPTDGGLWVFMGCV